MNAERRTFLGAGLIALAVAAVYWNSLEAPFLFDDAPAITDNPTIRQLWPPGPAWQPPANGSGVSGRPLVNFSFALNHAWGGVAVRGYHVTNVGLHLLAALVLWGVLRRTLRLPALAATVGTNAEWLAGSAALLWALHPLQTESVVCVVQRNEIMGGLFILLTVYGFIRSVSAPRHAGGWQVLAVVAGLLGVLSKEVVAVAPLLVLLHDRTFVAGTFREAWRRRGRFYVGLAATWLVLGWLVWQNRQRGGTVGFGLGVSSWDYLLTQCRALTLYLKLSVWPHPLIVDYGTDVVRSLGAVWGRGLVVVGLLVVTGVGLVRRPVLGFVGAWFFVLLAPSSSFVPLVTQTIAEHRMYLPLAAVVVLGLAGLHALAPRRAVLVGVVAVLAIGLGALTVQRNEDYRDGLQVWRGAVAAVPENARAHAGLANTHYQREEFIAARESYERSLRLDPRPAQVHYNLGLTLGRLERWAEAGRHLEAAVQRQPDFMAAHAELGPVLVRLGRIDEAVAHLEQARAGWPDDASIHNSLGMAAAAGGDHQAAVAAYERALALSPELEQVHFNLAVAQAALGQGDEALAAYRRAVELRPGWAAARLALGIALAQAGRYEDGLGHLQEAVRLQPALAAAHANLGIALGELGRTDEAVAAYGEALRLQPAYPMAHYNLGNALVRLRRWSEAKRHYAEAVRLAPEYEAARSMLESLQAVP